MKTGEHKKSDKENYRMRNLVIFFKTLIFSIEFGSGIKASRNYFDNLFREVKLSQPLIQHDHRDRKY